MVIFDSEADLLAAINHHDELVRQCVRGEINFSQFCSAYDNFYLTHALDGHESDDEERSLFQKHAARIDPHRIIAQDILGRLCAEEDAERETFKQAGRFDSREAKARLARVALPSS